MGFKLNEMPKEKMAQIQEACALIRKEKGVKAYEFAKHEPMYEGVADRTGGFTHCLSGVFADAAALKAYDECESHKKMKDLMHDYLADKPVCMDFFNNSFVQVYGSGHTMHGPVYRC